MEKFVHAWVSKVWDQRALWNKYMRCINMDTVLGLSAAIPEVRGCKESLFRLD
jgi:hypothetical protein